MSLSPALSWLLVVAIAAACLAWGKYRYERDRAVDEAIQRHPAGKNR